ncbi:trafficking kinesin-binding protein 1-like isoform X2 [Pomacea canaliculata]|uniref:trafficking kinesin-binding protein 1-like isoform X2 n=1 Tax=Pomacea canaliculata TaxID=400727 RepID=UPI000D737A41|nr:trafficking kinesin-binding protein 1-like isoform X2 [Pomacea canaliculata]
MHHRKGDQAQVQHCSGHLSQKVASNSLVREAAPWCAGRDDKLATYKDSSQGPVAAGLSSSQRSEVAPSNDTNNLSVQPQIQKSTRDVGTITDVCNDEDPDEVEIFCLIKEQIPRYRLRADSISDFGGYSHQDWIQTPIINLDEDLDLTDLQIAESLKYFTRTEEVLCAERVTQMTKTYNDIEAVTRLLEEKERDLELAARIGQTLLSKNKELNVRSEALEEQLVHANDKVNQLKHDLSMKEELLRFYCQDFQDETSSDSSPGEPTGPLGLVNIELLQRKVSTLEEENITLRLESAQLRTDTENFEDKEKRLVEDCLQQLGELNQQVETFAQELRYKTEESCRQKEEVTCLLAQVADLHKRVRQLTIENMDLAEKLQASQESQKQLTKELSMQQDKYDELFEMLEEAQDELRGHRSRGNPKATRHCYTSSALQPASGAGADSLASELQNSLQQQEEEKQTRKSRSWKVFETARAARKAASKSSKESSVRMSTSSTSSTKDPTSNAPSDSESLISDGYSADMDSLYGSNTELGRPGIPGSNDLESALRRLAMRRANELNERDFEAQLKQGFHERETRSEGFSPFQPRTPDSWASPASGYSYLGYSNSQSTPRHFKFPEKLQIVKPLEGSVTLQHWQRLAQPHLGGLFERREGVQVRGERKLDLEGEVYTLSDFEEDDSPLCPSRRADDSSMIYTFTNSIVSHPGELHLPHSASGSSFPSLGTSTPTGPSAKGQSRAGTGYSMPLGLAAILESREGAATRSLLHPVASRTSLQETSTLSPTPTTSANITKTTSSTSLIEAGATAGEGLTSSTSSGLFGKLMSTGYSLLWNKTSPTVSPISGDTSSLPPTSGEAKPQSKISSSSVLTGGGPTGVLGAIASFRKNGIL